MYESLAEFLQDTSSQAPLLWAILVMAVVAGTALVLYNFWQLVLRWVTSVLAGGRARAGGRG